MQIGVAKQKGRPPRCSRGGRHTIKSGALQRSAFFKRSVDDLGVKVEGVLRAAPVVGEERRTRDDGQRQRVDERVRREVGNRRTEEGEHGLRRVDREESPVLVGVHILHFKHAHKARHKVEGLGGVVRALDLAFQHDDIHLGVLVRVTDLAREHGFDFKFGIGRRLNVIDLKGELFGGQRLHGVFDHNFHLYLSFAAIIAWEASNVNRLFDRTQKIAVSTQNSQEIGAVRQNLEDAVTRLEGLIGGNASDVTALETALEEVTAAYAAADALLEADITTLQEQDTALSESITALQTTPEAADDAIWDAIGQLQSDLDASEQTLSTVIIVFAVILGVVAVVSVVGLVPALRKGKK